MGWGMHAERAGLCCLQSCWVCWAGVLSVLGSPVVLLSLEPDAIGRSDLEWESAWGKIESLGSAGRARPLPPPSITSQQAHHAQHAQQLTVVLLVYCWC